MIEQFFNNTLNIGKKLVKILLVICYISFIILVLYLFSSFISPVKLKLPTVPKANKEVTVEQATIQTIQKEWRTFKEEYGLDYIESNIAWDGIKSVPDNEKVEYIENLKNYIDTYYSEYDMKGIQGLGTTILFYNDEYKNLRQKYETEKLEQIQHRFIAVYVLLFTCLLFIYLLNIQLLIKIEENTRN